MNKINDKKNEKSPKLILPNNRNNSLQQI